MYFVANTLIVYANIYKKGRLIFFLQNFRTTAKLIRKGLVDKGKEKIFSHAKKILNVDNIDGKDFRDSHKRVDLCKTF